MSIKLLKAYLAAAFVVLISMVASGAIAVAQQAKIVKQDYHIDGVDPGAPVRASEDGLG